MAGVNLIPQDVRLAQSQRRRLRGWCGVAVGALAVFALALMFDQEKRAEAAQLVIEHNRLQDELAEARGKLRAEAREAGRALRQLERAGALRTKRAWSAVFNLLARCMPPTCWLRSVATDPAAPPPGSSAHKPDPQASTREASPLFIEAPRKLRIIGYALDAAHPHTFVTNLKETGVFAKVSLERTLRTPVAGGEYFQFELLCEW